MPCGWLRGLSFTISNAELGGSLHLAQRCQPRTKAETTARKLVVRSYSVQKRAEGVSHVVERQLPPS